MKYANQVCEQRFPDTKFKLVHEVNDHHFGNIEFFPKPLKEGVLSNIWSDIINRLWRRTLTTVGTEDVDLSTPSTPVPATACPNL